MTFHSFSGIFRLALISLLQHRLRSLLSIVGIICGVAAVFAILSIGEGAKREILASMRSLGLDNIILRRIPLPRQQLYVGRTRQKGIQCTDIPVLRAASRFIVDIAYLKELRVHVFGVRNKVMPQVVACSWSYLHMQGLTLVHGRYLLLQDEQQKNEVCVLGITLANQLGDRGKVGSHVRIDNHLFLVVGIVSAITPIQKKKSGIVQSRDINTMLFLPFGSDLYLPKNTGNTGSGSLDEIILKVSKSQSTLDLLPLIHRTMDIRHNNVRGYQVIVPRQIMAQAGRTQRIFNLILGSMGGISLVVGGIGIMNVLLATISERTREIGIRRAVGARRKDIVIQFLAESILLTSTGGLIGISIGFLCICGVARFAEWSIAITPLGIFIPLLTSVIVGLCAGLFPAVKASKMDPVCALRFS